MKAAMKTMAQKQPYRNINMQWLIHYVPVFTGCVFLLILLVPVSLEAPCDSCNGCCQNGGTCDTITITCSCPIGFDGDRCSNVVNCGIPSLPDSTVQYTSTNYASVATFTCFEGFTSAPYYSEPSYATFTAECESSGRWGGGKECFRLNCGSAPHVLQSNAQGDVTTFGAEVIYTCNSGYSTDTLDYTKNVIIATCGSDRTWKMPSVASCVTIDCLAPPEVDNARSTYQSTKYSSSVDYTCEVGYSTNALDVNAQSFQGTCYPEANWKIFESCKRVDCEMPVFDNAVATISSTTVYEDQVTIVCEAGFSTDPLNVNANSFNSSCLSDRSWSAVMGTCERIDCGTPTVLENADASSIQFTTTLFEAEAQHTCNEGFAVNQLDFNAKAVTAECVADRTWSSQPCLRIDCEQPNAVSYADITVSQTLFEDTASYTCHVGYSTDPLDVQAKSSSITCLGSRQWSPPLPCQRVDCESPQDVENADETFEGTVYEDQTTYTCIVGYSTDANDYTKNIFSSECGSDRAWSVITLSCVKVNCGNAPDVDSGSVTFVETLYKDLANYSCEYGYSANPFNLAGSSFSNECLFNGTWPEPACLKVNCGGPHVAHAYANFTEALYEDTMDYTCVPGYSLTPSNINDTTFNCTCQGNITWSNTPVCQRIECIEPIVVDLASLDLNMTYVYEDLASYTCDFGYSTNKKDYTANKFSLECLARANWSAPPACIRVECDKPQFPNTWGMFDGRLYKDIARFTCLSGYAVTPTNTSDNTFNVTCLGNQTWSQTPGCRKIDCEEPHNDRSASVTLPDTLFNSIASYICNPGYSLTPTDVQDNKYASTCLENRTWSDVPMCTKIDCGTPPQVNFITNISYDTTLFEDKASYICLPSLNVAISTCLQNRSWSLPCNFPNIMNDPLDNNSAALTGGMLDNNSAALTGGMLGNNSAALTGGILDNKSAALTGAMMGTVFILVLFAVGCFVAAVVYYRKSRFTNVIGKTKVYKFRAQDAQDAQDVSDSESDVEEESQDEEDELMENAGEEVSEIVNQEYIVYRVNERSKCLPREVVEFSKDVYHTEVETLNKDILPLRYSPWSNTVWPESSEMIENASSDLPLSAEQTSDVPLTDIPKADSPLAEKPTSDLPSDVPSDLPSDVPSDLPSDVLSDLPSDVPSDLPSDVPSDLPSASPLVEKLKSDSPLTDKPTSDPPVTENHKLDLPQSDVPCSDSSLSIKSKSDLPLTDKPASDSPLTDKSKSDKPMSGKSLSNKSQPDMVVPNKSMSDQSASDKAVAGKPKSDKPKSDKQESGTTGDKPESDTTDIVKPVSEDGNSDIPKTDKAESDKSKVVNPASEKPCSDNPVTDNSKLEVQMSEKDETDSEKPWHDLDLL